MLWDSCPVTSVKISAFFKFGYTIIEEAMLHFGVKDSLANVAAKVNNNQYNREHLYTKNIFPVVRVYDFHAF